jgi:hypothetical protein
MFRRDQLCPGSEVCPEVLNPGEPCPECPLQLLDDYLASPDGKWIMHVINLDFALQAGLTITPKDVRLPEFLMLRILAEERNKFHQEESEKRTKQQHGQ